MSHPDLDSGKVSIYENPFMSGGFRPRMWAHYGENHKGICIKFNGKKLDERIQELKKSFPDKMCEVFSGKVEYDDRWVIDGRKIYISLDIVSGFNDIEFTEWLRKNYFIENYRVIFLTKTKDWESEYEFRWLIHNEKDFPEFIPISEITEEVLVGSDFHKAYYPSLFEFCKELGIPAYRIFWGNGVPGRKRIFSP